MSKEYFEGRYEYSEGNSNKFWQLRKQKNGMFLASWGRIDCENPSDMLYDAATAEKKACEKVKKGYIKVS